MSKPIKHSAMNISDWKKLLPVTGAILIFLILSVTYVYPVLQGKRMMQPDIMKFEGMAKEIRDFRAQTGEEALWTNSMFGGMPAFQISVIYHNNIMNYIHKILTLGLPRPADMIFLYFVGFFVFMLVLKVNVWIALLGAVGFAFSAYHFIIIDAGHNSKALAIAYMAPVLAAMHLAFKGKYLAGGILFSIALGLQLTANHLQITYYLLITAVFYGLFLLVSHMRENRIADFAKATGVLVVAAVFAVGVNTGNFWSTYEYSAETMRGGSELTIQEESTTSGLSREYITNWSYGIGETFSFLIPNVKGGATGALGENERAMEKVDPTLQRNAAQANHYWGDQPFTSGPAYAGVVVLFLFILSLFIVKGAIKWGLVAAAFLAVLLAWGQNFMAFTNFFIDYVPGYNKFRAVSMTLVVVELVLPALAFLGLNEIYKGNYKINIKSPAFLTALGLTAGFAFIFYVAPTAFFSFFSREEGVMFADWMNQQQAQSDIIRQLQDNIEAARVSIFRADALRSIFFALATAVVIWLFAAGKIRKTAFIAIVGLLLLVDLWPVSLRYFGHDKFVPKRQLERPYQPTQANQQILQDNDPHFRVYNVTVSSFNDTSTSFFHKSIGGYHGAKLQRFQDLIDVHIIRGNMHILNMLNTRYFIVPGQDRQPTATFNEDALGNAWFVHEIQWVDNADQEILALNDIAPDTTAVIDRRFESQVHISSLQPGEDDSITLVSYAPNELRYRAHTSAPQLALFSEVYYPHGWEVTINGEKADHFRANYILRGMIVPAGDNEIVFAFRPASYFTGEVISLIFSILLLLAIGYYAYISWKAQRVK
jgi:hypothetical protein